MVESCKILYEGGSGEIVEKKSRFIATTRPVETEEEALAFIEEIRKKYWDARHNCFAYVIGEKNQLQRCSDDGEPSQTAGRPMLDVLLGEDVHDACVVVTRYFGGVLLGTGGLVRAYSRAVQEGLAASRIVVKRLARVLTVSTDYNGIGKIQYLAASRELASLDISYTDKVTAKYLVPMSNLDEFTTAVTEATGGRAVMEESEPVYFGAIGKEIVLF